jgi:hypothetical protein
MPNLYKHTSSLTSPLENYAKTDRQLHWLSQLVAKANRTFLPKKEDDSHTNLYFDTLGHRIAGRWIEAANREILFTLNFANQSIEIIDHRQETLASIPTVSFTMSEVEKKIEQHLVKLGLNPKGYSDSMHYDMPDYYFSDKVIPVLDQSDLLEWASYRQIANEVCRILLGYSQTQAEIRIWPHHFDTGIYIDASESVSIGFGLAMQSDLASCPYFYMTGYPKSGTINYEKAPNCADWKWELGEDWKGAILPLNLLNGKSIDDQKLMVRRFLIETFSWFIKQ